MNSALDAIGATPLIHLSRVHRGPGRLLAKLEFRNPGGSIKDRPARYIIETAGQSGELLPRQPVVEMTSGNMGAGLALVCAVLGHPFVAVMSEGNSPRRRTMIAALGAEVVLVPQVDGQPGRVTGADVKRAAKVARGLATERGGYYVNQFFNPGSVGAHEHGTGPEILQDTAGDLALFAACVGSGGTFVGTARALKRSDPKIWCVAVEPANAAILSTGHVDDPQHAIQGVGYGVIPPHWEPKLADEIRTVTDLEAETMRARLAAEEGLFVGYSAAANVVAASEALRTLCERGELSEDATGVTILCDTGLKYD